MKTFFYIGVLLALAPLYGLGVILIEILNVFSIISQTETGVEPNFADSIKTAILAVMMILPCYLGAALSLIPLLHWGALKEALIIRNILIGTSLIVLLSVPVGTVVGVVILATLVLTRGRFKT